MNELGENLENMKQLGEAMKKLPSKLEEFLLYLVNNNLEENEYFQKFKEDLEGTFRDKLKEFDFHY